MYLNENSNNGSRFHTGLGRSGSGGRIGKDLWLWGVVLVVLSAIAVGDVEEDAIAAGGDVGASESAVIASESDLQALGGAAEGKTIRSIRFEKDFGVRQALAMLASLYEKNIVPTPNVEGVLAFRSLSNVTLAEAMDAVLGANFKYEKRGNLIKVYTRQEYEEIRTDKDRMINKVFTLYYITAKEAEALIRPVLSDIGLIQASSEAETGVPAGESISSDSAGGDTMAAHDTIIVRDFPERIVEVTQLLRSLDIRPKQVLIEATILTATLTEGMELGVDLNLLGGVSLTGTAASGGLADEVLGGYIEGSRTTGLNALEQIHALDRGQPLEVAGFAAVGSSGLRLGISVGNAVALITALESVTDVTVLANPKILAVNKQLGQVYIGKKIGYKAQVTQTQTSTTESVKFLDTGTKLSFRPYIGDDGYIRMDIHPKDSSGNLNDQGVPDEDSTELATNIIVKDGETIVIGGLFRDVVTTTRRQVPLLGDIPLLGELFKGSTDVAQRQEVIVLLTPHIIEEPIQTCSEARVEDVSRKRFGAKEGLRWPGRARLADDHYANAAKYYLEGDIEAALNEIKLALRIRPTYLEAIRLRERIIGEMTPEQAEDMKRNVVGRVERRDLLKWQRR